MYSSIRCTSARYSTGRVIAEIDENGNRTEHEYDAIGRRTLTRDALNNVTTFAYDANGNLISQTDANSNTTQYEYAQKPLTMMHRAIAFKLIHAMEEPKPGATTAEID